MHSHWAWTHSELNWLSTAYRFFVILELLYLDFVEISACNNKDHVRIKLLCECVEHCCWAVDHDYERTYTNTLTHTESSYFFKIYHLIGSLLMYISSVYTLPRTNKRKKKRHILSMWTLRYCESPMKRIHLTNTIKRRFLRKKNSHHRFACDFVFVRSFERRKEQREKKNWKTFNHKWTSP